MRYLGGKARQAKHISKLILGRAAQSTAYYEPFLGGASILERVASGVPNPVASDAHPDLMIMWRDLVDGWVPPESVTRDEYASIKGDERPSALRGFVGFGCSFGGKWFGGYASARGDDYCGQSRRAVLRQSKVMRDSAVRLIWQSYRDIDPKPGSLIYCDPPYADTTTYAGLAEFDHDAFWRTANAWAESGCTVLVSEYIAPEGTPVLWQRDAVKSLQANHNKVSSVEKLFILEGRNNMTTDTSSFFGEQQSNDVPRDQWGRYKLPDADGETTGWTRATTFAATLAEQYGLSIWHQRQVVWGLSRRTDLIELAATIAGPEDKKALGSIVDEAHIAAGTEAKANRGTALHKASEIGDRAGSDAGSVPPQFDRDYRAYQDALDRAGIVILPEWIERVLITPDYHVAGTPDRLVLCLWDHKIRVLDLKTGNLDYAQLEWSVQLAMYAHAKAARNYATNTYEQLPEIADDFAIVAHIRPESGVCELYRVDIRMGWAFARLCAEVRDARQHKALLTPLVVEPGNAFAVAAAPELPSIAQRATAAIEAVKVAHHIPVTQEAIDGSRDTANAIAQASGYQDMAAALSEVGGVILRTGDVDTADFWSGSEDWGNDGDGDSGLTYNGVPLAEYGKPVESAQSTWNGRDTRDPDLRTADEVASEEGHNEAAAQFGDQAAEQRIDAATPDAMRAGNAPDAESAAIELSKRPKAQLQQIARDLMAGNPGASVKLNQHRIKIAREIVAAAASRNVEIPGVTGSGAHNAKPTTQPAPGLDQTMDAAKRAGVDTSAADRVAEAREAQWRATMFDEIRHALTVAKLEVLRSQAGEKWDDQMTEVARKRVEEIDSLSAASATRVLSPLDMIRGATSRETLSKAWEVATNRGSNLDGWTAELDSAAKDKMVAL